jgi:hypothetical protein
VTSAPNGWFAVCDAPRDGITTLQASRGADSTALIDVQASAEGYARRDLYVGRTATTAAGPAPLSGTVLTALGAQPLAGAQVRIPGGPETRANERGEWTLANAPAGTRMLEVRAVGYFPERRAVDVVSDAAPVRVRLSTLKSVLDTIRVTAAATPAARLRSGFEERRRSTTGRFLTAAEIARRGGGVTASRLFRSFNGIRIGVASDTLIGDNLSGGPPPDAVGGVDDPRILMRGGIGGRWCAPTIYIDGVRIPQASTDDIDAAVDPDRIAGLEIYMPAGMPAQFADLASGCGAILIWRK